MTTNDDVHKLRNLIMELQKMVVRLEERETNIKEQISDLKSELDTIKTHINDIHVMANRWKGGFIVLTALGGIIGWVLSTWTEFGTFLKGA